MGEINTTNTNLHPTTSTVTTMPQAQEAQQDSSTAALKSTAKDTVVPTTTGGESVHSTTPSKGRSSLRRHSSAFIAAVRTTFTRKTGPTGASVQALRGNSGADFEGYATVHRGDDSLGLPALCCCFGSSRKDGLYFLLIKGYYCFVFDNEDSKAPKYAIELMHLKAVIQPSHVSHIPLLPHPGANHETSYTTIFLETSLGDVEYKFTFANTEANVGTKFCNAVAVAANEANAEQVRKRLGHEGLNRRRSSVKYAQAIGQAKAKDQPSAPITAGEVLSAMPASAGY